MAIIYSAADLLGRVLLAALFAIEAWIKISGYAGAVAYSEKFGVPGNLLPAAIALEAAGALLIVIGWYTRVAAFLLAGFCILTAIIFHNNFANANEQLHFLKDFAIAGGFLVLFARGAGDWSIDARRGFA
jgi:putative oxidoreductase